MPLTDSQGRKVDTGLLLQEIAEPSLTDLRQPYWQSLANVLTPELLGGILQSVDQGNAWQYLILAYELEDRWPHFYSVISTRKRGVSGLTLNIEDGADKSAKAKKMADFCRDALSRRRTKPLMDHAMDALAKGYSAVEIMWDKEGPQWWPREFRYRDARFFKYDLLTGQELRIYDMQDPGFGIPIPPFKMVVHQPNIKSGLPIKRGFARLALAAYLCQAFALRDWELFASRFGMPFVFGKYPQGATGTERSQLMAACSGLAAGGSGTYVDTMSIEIKDGGTRSGGDKIFENLVTYYDRALSKAVLGQTATTEGTPGRLGADDTQENVREDLRDSDAEEMEACIERDVIKPMIDLNFGPQPESMYPTASLPHEAPEDMEKTSKAMSVYIDRGLRVKEDEIREKFRGLTKPEEGDDILVPFNKTDPTPPGELDPDLDGGPPAETGDVPADQNPDNAERKAITPPKDSGKQSRRVFPKTASAMPNAVAKLVEKAASGVPLNDDERLALAAAARGTDMIDGLADEAAKRWRKITDPMREQVSDRKSVV